MANYYLSGNYNNTIDVILSLTESTDTTANTSTFSYTLYIYKKNNTSYSYSRGNHYGVTIGSYTTGDNTGGYSLGGVPLGGTYTLLTGTTSAIAHNSDGSGTVTISAWVRQDQLSNYNFSLSQTINLTSIPRASKPTASNATIGNTITINTNRASSSFTHTIQYKIGSLGYTNIATGVGASVNWTLPASLANYISNATSGTVTINCITYNGSTQIGTATTTLTATIPGSSFSIGSTGTVTMGNNNNVTVTNTCSAYLTVSVTWSYGNGSGTVTTNWGTTTYNWPMSTFASKIPSATSGTCTVTQTTKRGTAQINQSSKTFTLALGSTNPSASVSISDANGYASRFGGYLTGKSKLSWSVSASASQGSSISSYSVSVGGIGTYSTATGSVAVPSSLSTADRTVSVTVKDARGKTATASAAYKTVAYKAPTVSATVTRADSSGNPQPSSGTYIRIRGSVTWSAVTNNSVSAKYRIRQQNGSWPSTFTNLTLSNNNFDVTVGTYTYEVGWEVQIVAADSVDTTGTTASFTVGSAVFPIDVYPSQTSGIAFGKVSTKQGTVSVSDTWYLEVCKRRGISISTGSGAAYLHMFTINSGTSTYNNQVIKIKALCRSWAIDSYLYFENANSSTLTVDGFICDIFGDGTDRGIYAHCSGNTCDIYLSVRAWEDVVYSVDMPSKDGLSITPIKSRVESLPSEYVSATVRSVRTVDYTQITGKELRFTSSGLPQFSGAPQYLVGIESFPNGGTLKWKDVSAITVGAASTATTATKIDTANNNGYTTDEWGNFNHSSTDTSNYWHINKNNGSAVFSVYFESGIVDIASTGDYRKNGTSIVPTSTTTNTSGFIKFPNIKMMIAWRWVAWTGAISNAWGTGYESTAVISLGNWAASFNEEPKVVYGVRADSGQSGVTIEHYGKPSTTSAGSVYLWRPSTMTSQKYWICAIGIGKYT